MNEPILIGLSGRKESGKSTVGKFMYEWARENGYKPEIRGFAWLLKLSFTRIFLPDATVDEAVEYCDWFKESGLIAAQAPPAPIELFNRWGSGAMTGREALQNYGTEAHREIFGSDFWVDALLPTNDDAGWDRTSDNSGFLPDSDFCIITDVRFPNEALRINDLGGRVYEVSRPSLEEDGDTHASETPLEDHWIWGHIENDEGLWFLKDVVRTELELTTVDTRTRT